MKHRSKEKMAEHANQGGFVAGMIGLVMLLNILLAGIVEAFSLYLFAEVKYEHHIGEGIVDYLEEFSHIECQANIIFCMEKEDLEKDPVYALVYHTATQLADTLSFVKVSHINVSTHPNLVEKYRYEQTEGGEAVPVRNINRSSVIIDGGRQFIVLSLSSFFLLDANDAIEAYYGEKVMGSMVRYVLTEQHPKAYYTQNHGESASKSLLNLLTCAGYDVTPIDLLTETPTDTTGILLIANPLYDFIRGAEGVWGEIQKVEAYMQAGGLVVACFDPLASGLTHLEELFASWGVSSTHAIVRDSEGSITPDGYTLVCSYGENEQANTVKAKAQTYSKGRVIVREAAAPSLEAKEGLTVSPLLVSSPSSATYQKDQQTSNEGKFPISALSVNAHGGGVLLTASYYLTAGDALNSNEYGNEDYLYGLMAQNRDIPMPLGCTLVHIDNTRLDNLTMQSARWWTVLLAVALPVSVAVTGFVVLYRRKERRMSR